MKVLGEYARLLTLADLESESAAEAHSARFSACTQACDSSARREKMVAKCCEGLPEELGERCAGLARRAHELCRRDPRDQHVLYGMTLRAFHKAGLIVAATLIAAAVWFKGRGLVTAMLAHAGVDPMQVQGLVRKLEEIRAKAPSLPELSTQVWGLLASVDVAWTFQVATIYGVLSSVLPTPVMFVVNAALVGALGLKGVELLKK